MKKEWKEPKIEVQKFMPNEYVAACWVFTETNVVVTTPVSGGVLTDGRTDTPSNWQGPTMGFSDDHFDYLNASDDDVVPAGGGTGWYSNTIDHNSANWPNISIHWNSPGQPKEFSGSYGNKEIPDMAEPVYFWGNWPTAISSSNCKQYGVGPNAS